MSGNVEKGGTKSSWNVNFANLLFTDLFGDTGTWIIHCMSPTLTSFSFTSTSSLFSLLYLLFSSFFFTTFSFLFPFLGISLFQSPPLSHYISMLHSFYCFLLYHFTSFWFYPYLLLSAFVYLILFSYNSIYLFLLLFHIFLSLSHPFFISLCLIF